MKYFYFFLTLLSIDIHSLSAQFDFKKLDTLLRSGRTEKIFPGALALIGYKGEIIYHKAFGRQTYDQHSLPITKNTLFDLASVTKVMTTTCVMLLSDRKQLSVHDKVCRYVPNFNSPDKKAICIKHLLTHTSGLTNAPLLPCKQPAQVLDCINAYPLKYPTGSTCVYSDTNFIVLQKIIENITQQPFQNFVKKEITFPLGMCTTTFTPLDKQLCAPTRLSGVNREYLIQGEVDDDVTHMLGGVAGHAGLFSTAGDFAKFMLMLLRNGAYYKNNKQLRLLKPETLHLWTQLQCSFAHENGKRGYGWEIGRHLSKEAFGHFGWTGTSLWADKKLDLFCILFTNSVHPTYANRDKMKEFRIKFHDLVLETIRSAP